MAGTCLTVARHRKKPRDDTFLGEMSLKNWVKQSLPDSVTQVIDANFLRNEEEQYAAKKDYVTSILRLALECSADSPGVRIGMQDVPASLEKIKLKFKKDELKALDSSSIKYVIIDRSMILAVYLVIVSVFTP
ncbi:unnamed protein product [Dovyalis caffra]|uniref:Uncharacterized protein n=1 Tax=Dovyalis caffra TaxID=77055 RepID=A0AAV1S320_9ROSI|nr:unnamed protein product [Dovyalis caffra]